MPVDDQIDRDDVVENTGHQQDQNAGEQRDQRLQMANAQTIMANLLRP